MFLCKICNKIFKQKSHYISHCNRKRPCKDDNLYNYAKIAKNMPKNAIENLELDHKKTNKGKHKDVYELKNLDMPNYAGKMVKEYQENNIIDVTSSSNKQNFVCNFCNKTFTQSGTLNRHTNERCKEREKQLKILEEQNNKTTEKYLTEINFLKEQIIKMKEIFDNFVHINTNNSINTNKSINTDNSNNTNNNINNQINGNITTNNIKIEKIEFGKEDLSKLSDSFFINTLMYNSGASIPCKIIEGIHFNPKLKENMNVYITDVSRNKAMIHNGKQWITADANKVVDDLFDKAVSFCEIKNEELYEQIQKNVKYKKKINKEMYVMDIMTNYNPYKINEDKQPVDIDGNILNVSELKRGESLNGVAKKYIKNSITNNKEIVLLK